MPSLEGGTQLRNIGSWGATPRLMSRINTSHSSSMMMRGLQQLRRYSCTYMVHVAGHVVNSALLC